ncbi:U-scoloptoxin(05)-Cw1a isoform X2 [Macrosteles quadrilineatus]|uniref:U-scoloptoxin(05)-Cw1a isoform X2 n=1 Tax=Macrosteles quadrilineatus TaxID=74068 RepID=UPI0023E0BF94|nr:U-scoloptoxin(05)-Cw1a isoform X2 [Macrosteles quadrilineatus]
MCMLLVYGIDCYQCTSATNIDCGAPLINDRADSSLEPTSCSYMFEASYCVKTTGLHSGGLGTKRFCSSLDLGNYCNYIRQPGDMMEYRSCVYTCDSDGCNAGNTLRLSLTHITAALTITLASTKLFS